MIYLLKYTTSIFDIILTWLLADLPIARKSSILKSDIWVYIKRNGSAEISIMRETPKPHKFHEQHIGSLYAYIV